MKIAEFHLELPELALVRVVISSLQTKDYLVRALPSPQYP